MALVHLIIFSMLSKTRHNLLPKTLQNNHQIYIPKVGLDKICDTKW